MTGATEMNPCWCGIRKGGRVPPDLRVLLGLPALPDARVTRALPVLLGLPAQAAPALRDLPAPRGLRDLKGLRALRDRRRLVVVARGSAWSISRA